MIALLRTEFVKAARRTRTLVMAAILIGLPTLIVVAIKGRGARENARGDNGPGLFRLAQQSGVLVPAAVLSVMSGFLLVVISGMFAGDSVAGDSAWGNLRYVLMRPINRTKLLFAKMAVAGTLIWISIILVTLAALGAGVAAFGVHTVAVPAGLGSGAGGFSLTASTMMLRVVIAAAYVAFGFTALLALGTFFSTLTDTPTGAISATVGVYIVSLILDSISELGQVRYAFPTHYLDAWEPMFTQNHYPKDMLVGLIVQVAYLVVFTTLAAMWFERKDIHS